MNSSIIISDIRKRSIRLQREQILENVRQEEALYDMPLSQRLINEAEERAREKTDSQSWKKSFMLFLFFLGCMYILYRLLKTDIRKELRPPKMVTTSIQTDSPDPIRQVRFTEDPKLERLKQEYPREWKNFDRDQTIEWLRSPITGPLLVDFLYERHGLAVDVINNDILEYPNNYHKTEEQFENFIYERELKNRLCSENGIEYNELYLTTDTS